MWCVVLHAEGMNEPAVVVKAHKGQEHGIKKYGTNLLADTHNAMDAREEKVKDSVLVRRISVCINRFGAPQRDVAIRVE